MIDYKTLIILSIGIIGGSWVYYDHQFKLERLEFERQRWAEQREAEERHREEIGSLMDELKNCEERAMKISDKPEYKSRAGQAYDYLITECRHQFDVNMRALELQQEKK